MLAGSGMDLVKPPAYGRGIFVSIASAAAVFALAIMASGGDSKVTGVPMTETTTPLFWGLSLIVIAIVGVGAQYAEVTADRAAAALGQPRTRERMPTAWAVPMVAVATAILMVATYHNRVMLAAGPAIAFFGVAGALLARDLLDDVTEATQRTASTIHTLVIHAVAFLALSAVYLNKMSGWVGAPLVAILSGVLILEALERGEMRNDQRILYATIGGLAMGQALIPINWWPTHGWTGGAALLICFFALCGIMVAQATRSRLRQRDVLEYGLVTLLGLAVLALTL